MAAQANSSLPEASYPVLILKMSPTPVHHGALAVARTLGRRGVRVYAVVEDGFTPLAVSRYLIKAFVWDRRPADADSFVKAMSLIADAIGRPAIVIPMDDLSAVTLAANASTLSRWFVLPPVAPQVPHQLANKAHLHALCRELGIPTVHSIVPACFEDVRAFCNSTQFPVVLKAAEQWLPVKDAFCTKVIETREGLFDICEHYDYRSKQRLIIQEYISGEDWIAHGYYNATKNISLTFTGKKLCSYPTEAGSTALGLSVDNEMLRDKSEQLLKSVGYSGIIDMDWRKDVRDGQFKILDCNPRVGQNFRMFEDTAGLDVVAAEYLDLSGNGIDHAPQVDGRLFTVESFYALALLRESMGAGSKRGGCIHRPAHQGSELAWWASDDPVPFFVMTVRVVSRTLYRAFDLLLYTPVRSWLSHLFSHPHWGEQLSPKV